MVPRGRHRARLESTIVGLTRGCSKTGCARPAVATLTYAYADRAIVLGPLATYAEPHTYDLCRDHAERHDRTARLGASCASAGSSPSRRSRRDDLLALADAVREAGRPRAHAPPPGQRARAPRGPRRRRGRRPRGQAERRGGVRDRRGPAARPPAHAQGLLSRLGSSYVPRTHSPTSSRPTTCAASCPTSSRPTWSRGARDRLRRGRRDPRRQARRRHRPRHAPQLARAVDRLRGRASPRAASTSRSSASARPTASTTRAARSTLPGAMFTASHNPARTTASSCAAPVPARSARTPDSPRSATWRSGCSTAARACPRPSTGSRHSRGRATCSPTTAPSCAGSSTCRGIRPAQGRRRRRQRHGRPHRAGRARHGGRPAELPLEIVPLYFELDGTFPNHEANPLDPANLVDLQAAVREHGADIGLAFDGDADRCFVVDARRRAGVAERHHRPRRRPRDRPGARRPATRTSPSCTTSSPARPWPRSFASTAPRPIRTRVGHSFIKAEMARTGAVFGGEHSAHYYFRDFWFADTGMLAAMHVLAALGEQDRPLAEICATVTSATPPRARSTRPSTDQPAVVEQIEAWAVVTRCRHRRARRPHRLRAEAPTPMWWFNVRASNTEPLLRLNVEAADRETMERLRDEVLGLIRGSRPVQPSSARPEKERTVSQTNETIEPWLREILRCPQCKGELSRRERRVPEGAGVTELQCASCRLAYPIEDGVPVLLVDLARSTGPEPRTVFDESRLDDVDAIARLDPAAPCAPSPGAGAAGPPAPSRHPRTPGSSGSPTSSRVGSSWPPLADPLAVADSSRPWPASGAALPVQSCTSAPLPGWVGALDLVIAVSQSGEPPAPLSLAAEAARRGRQPADDRRARTRRWPRSARGPAGSTCPSPLPDSSSRTSMWAQATPAAARRRRPRPRTVGRPQPARRRRPARRAAPPRCRPSSESFVNPAKVLATEVAESSTIVLGDGPWARSPRAGRSRCSDAPGRMPVAFGVLPDGASQIVACFDGPLAGGRGRPTAPPTTSSPTPSSTARPGRRCGSSCSATPRSGADRRLTDTVVVRRRGRRRAGLARRGRRPTTPCCGSPTMWPSPTSPRPTSPSARATTRRRRRTCGCCAAPATSDPALHRALGRPRRTAGSSAGHTRQTGQTVQVRR